jgi:hypothetical protein
VRPRDRRGLLTVAVVSSAVCGLVAVAQAGGSDSQADAAPGAIATASTVPASSVPAPSVPASSGVPDATGEGVTESAVGTDGEVQGVQGIQGLQDLDGEGVPVGEDCVLEGTSVRLGESGADVSCVQLALIDAGLLDGSASGVFDGATDAAVRRLQEER